MTAAVPRSNARRRGPQVAGQWDLTRRCGSRITALSLKVRSCTVSAESVSGHHAVCVIPSSRACPRFYCGSSPRSFRDHSHCVTTPHPGTGRARKALASWNSRPCSPAIRSATSVTGCPVIGRLLRACHDHLDDERDAPPRLDSALCEPQRRCALEGAASPFARATPRQSPRTRSPRRGRRRRHRHRWLWPKIARSSLRRAGRETTRPGRPRREA